MSFRNIKGWVSKEIEAKDLMWWAHYQRNIMLTLKEEGVISRAKGRKSDWQDSAWPPRKVTITIIVDE